MRSTNLPFLVESLDVERLLADWRWLCPESMTLVARNAFGGLFLQAADSKIFWLDVEAGCLTEIAATFIDFQRLLNSEANREQWFAELEASRFAERGFAPDIMECVGFKTPLVFAESGAAPNNIYIADLYERVSFLGDLNRQMANMSDGTKVKLRIKRD